MSDISNDNDPLSGQTKRKVYSTFYWEDRDRDDDPDGPDEDIY